MLLNLLLIYFFPFLFILVFYLYRRQLREKESREIQKKQIEAGRLEPASLHPLIDPAKCMGCASCISACPEKNVLGIINQKSTLIAPASCIGHGVCKLACPFGAITLVYGTQKRGVDIPFVQPNFETNIPGVFITGELGSMGVIRNAIEQGRLAITEINKQARKKEKIPGVHDVVIVGAGPAGFSASLSAIKQRLNYVTLEQESLGGMLSRYPKDKIITTYPVVLPFAGRVHFNGFVKDQVLKFWQDIERRSGVKINYFERVDEVIRQDKYLKVITPKNIYHTQAILLAIGRRLISRKLCVPGEEKSKVVYRFADPEQYHSQHVLVVGGGDVAIEAALAVAGVSGTTVSLSYRGENFSCVKQANLQNLKACCENGRLNVFFNSNVEQIKDKEVLIEQLGKEIVLQNDAVIVCGGGVLPIPFLKEIGIKVEAKYGTA